VKVVALGSEERIGVEAALVLETGLCPLRKGRPSAVPVPDSSGVGGEKIVVVGGKSGLAGAVHVDAVRVGLRGPENIVEEIRVGRLFAEDFVLSIVYEVILITRLASVP